MGLRRSQLLHHELQLVQAQASGPANVEPEKVLKSFSYNVSRLRLTILF
jgi:hypothetical protein